MKGTWVTAAHFRRLLFLTEALAWGLVFTQVNIFNSDPSGLFLNISEDEHGTNTQRDNRLCRTFFCVQFPVLLDEWWQSHVWSGVSQFPSYYGSRIILFSYIVHTSSVFLSVPRRYSFRSHDRQTEAFIRCFPEHKESRIFTYFDSFRGGNWRALSKPYRSQKKTVKTFLS